MGKTKIDIVLPDGFVSITEDMPVLKDVVDRMAKSSPLKTIYGNYIPESSVGAALSGDEKAHERNATLEIYLDYRKNEVVSKADFATLKEIKKRHLIEIFKFGKVDKEGRTFLYPHFESDNIISSSKIDFDFEGESSKELVAKTSSYVHLGSSVVTLHVTGSKDDLSWTRETCRKWAEKYVDKHSHISSPLVREKPKGSPMASRSRFATYILIIFGFLLLFGWVFAKIEGRSKTNHTKA